MSQVLQTAPTRVRRKVVTDHAGQRHAHRRADWPSDQDADHTVDGW